MNFETVIVEIEEGIATLTLNRPDKLNALNAQLFSDLESAFTQLRSHETLRCVIVTGAGPKAFAAGADIAELQACDEKTGFDFARRGQLVFNLIENFPVPVIAAVNGFALGGGCELAMACHIRIASDKAKFGQPEVKLGIIPGYGGTQRMTRLCGTAVAIELVCSGDMISAERALQIGLVNQVVGAEELQNKVRDLAKQISSMAALAVRASLDCVRNHAAGDNGMMVEAKAFAEICGSDDFREGTSAFLEKRSASFSGR